MAVTSKLFTSDSKLNVSMKLAALTRSYSRSNTLTISQAASSSTGFAESISNSLTISQAVSSQSDFARSISQPLIVAQTVARVATLGKSLSNSLTISQNIENLSATGKLGIINSKPGFTERLGGIVDESADQSIGSSLSITQAVKILLSNPRASNTLVITQVLSRSGSVFAHSASNSLTIIQVVDEQKYKPQSASTSLTLTQSATYLKTTGASQSLTITQSVVYAYAPHLELSTQFLTVTQTLARNAIRPRSISQSLVIAQAAAKTKIVTRSISQSLVVAQTAIGVTNSGAVQTLTITQSAAAAVLRNNSIPTQSLHITQSVQVRLVLSRSLTSTLVLLNYHTIPDGQGGFIAIPNLLYAKGGPADDAACNCNPGGGSTFFQAPSRAIVLPNPEFGDRESNVGAVKITRTITGGTFSYVKRSVNRKLKYKFHITQRKAFELRQFLLDFMATRLTMTNWKGEMWTGYFLSDPAEITSIARGEACIGDLYEVELDFQGIRIN